MRSWFRAAVELRHRKISRGLAEDLVGLPQLADLPLQRLEARALIRRQPGAQTLVALGLSDPLAQGLARAADLLRDRADRLVLRGIVAAVIKNQADRSLADLG